MQKTEIEKGGTTVSQHEGVFSIGAGNPEGKAVAETKNCTRCQRVLPVDQFRKHKPSSWNRDGLNTWCKECESLHRATRKEGTKEEHLNTAAN